MMNIYPYLKRCQWFTMVAVYILVSGCNVPETDFIKPIPIAMEASGIQSTSFIAIWKPVLGSSIYIVDVSVDPLFSSYVTGYQSREIEDDSLEVTGLAAEVTYYYRVRAQKDRVFSDNSNVIGVTTAALDAPVSLSATGIKVFQFTANWTPVEAAASYLVEIATDADFNNILPAYNGIEVVNTTLIVEGLNYKNTYYYRVKAKRLEKTSGYSNVIEVKPCISDKCKLSKITYSSGLSVEILYDNAGQVSTITNNYNGDLYTNSIIYKDNSVVDSVLVYINGELYEKNVFEYNSNGLYTSIYIYDTDNALTSVKDYIYNDRQQLIGFRRYTDESKTTLMKYENYELDDNGNVLRIANENEEQRGEFRYDENFNPKMLIPSAARLFVGDSFSGFDGVPYLGINNPNYAKGFFLDFFGEEEEVFIYDLNTCDVALARKGFYKLTYEFTGCDF